MHRQPIGTAFVLSLVFCLGLHAPAVPAETTPPEEQAPALVRQLGAADFAQREIATDALMKIGPAAKAALLAGAKDADPEVSYRSERLLVTILEEDFKARLAGFVADKEGKQEHDLPGLARFRKMLGNDPTTRDLYVEMANANRQLLEEAEANPKGAGARHSGEAQRLMFRAFGQIPADRRPVTFPEVAVLLFVAADPNVTVVDQSRQFMLNLLYQPAFQQTVQNGPRSDAAKKLLGAFMLQASGPMSQQFLQLAIQYKIKEGVDLAVKLIKDKDYAFGQSITTIGKLGGKEHLPILVPLLKNDTALTGQFNFNGKMIRTEVRDVALAMSVALQGQSIKDFGFEFLQGNNEAAYVSPILLGFENKEKRDAAFKKYQDWLDKQEKK
jgi:hypothetical protein